MTLLNYIIYTAFCILFQLLVEIESQTIIYRPDLREAHTATFINDRLYILGGAIPPYTNYQAPQIGTFFYLDCSAPFNTNELKWIDLSNNNIVPSHAFAAAAKGGANNNTLFLYGGESLGGEPMSPVYTFNTLNNTWNAPTIAGAPPNGKFNIIPVVDYNGLIYIFGGSIANVNPISIYYNNMTILNSINLHWEGASSNNAPSPRVQYGSVLLPDKSILYMGGYNVNSGPFTLNTVYLYDTINNIWTTKETNGLIPSARSTFSSVLGLDGQKVIIFGGYDGSGLLTPENSLYVLNLNNFNWSVPTVSGKIPSSRHFHKTVLIGKYMVVTFGEGYVRGTDNDVLLLDISNNDEYIWTTNFVPPSLSLIPSSPSSPVSTTIVVQSSNTQPDVGAIVGAVIGSIFGGILLSIGSFLLYRWYKRVKEQNKAVPTPGEASEIVRLDKQ